MQFSLAISHCNITFVSFFDFHKVVATLVRRGRWSSYRHMYRSSIIPAVKTALKSVGFSRSYRQKCVGSVFYGSRCTYNLPLCACCADTGRPAFVNRGHVYCEMVAHLSFCWALVIGLIVLTSSSAIAERPRDARVTSISQNCEVEFLSHPLGELRGNVDASCVRRWKKRGRLPIGDNWTF